MRRRLFALVRARLMEIVRDRSALLWNLLVVPSLVIGMAVVFSGKERPLFTVGVLGDAPQTAQTHAFFATPAVRFYSETDKGEGLTKVARHRIDLLIDGSAQPLHYWFNPQSQKSRLLQSLLQAGDADAAAESVDGTAVSYADWLVPGLLGVNIMFSCLFAIGHVIVRYRKSGYLKRLSGTPLRAFEFISAQLIACLLLVITVAVVVYTGCSLLLHLHMQGSYFDLFIITVLGAMSLIALSLVIAARVSSEELSGGLLNLLSWPMVVLSGVFFSLDGAPHIVQSAANIFPLTHLLNAARAVMLDGANLADVIQPLAIMAGMTAVFLALGAWSFRWTQE